LGEDWAKTVNNEINQTGRLRTQLRNKRKRGVRKATLRRNTEGFKVRSWGTGVNGTRLASGWA